jgi:membrane-associated protease RseP (regulator of RpoE activity)
MDYSFLFSEPFFAILFILILGIVLWFKRDKLVIQKWIYPLLYLVMYRTKWGLKKMDSIARNNPKLVKYISYTGVYIGFVGMLITVGFLLFTIYKVFMGSTEAAVGIAQPFVKTEFGSPFIYIPLVYFIVAIFIIAVSHEACHGIVARLHKVKIKSSGFAFLSLLVPIIPAAFVEPEEEEVKKLKPMKQLSIFAAGPFANILLAIIAILLLLGMNSALSNVITQDVVIINYTAHEELTFPAEQANIGFNEKIIMIDNINITSLSFFIQTMSETKPNQTIILNTNVSNYNITLTQYGEMESGYLGVMVDSRNNYAPWFKEKLGWSISLIDWIMGLFVILFIFNLGVGLINLVPIGPLDGGRMILTLLMMRYKKEKAVFIWSKISMITLLLLLAVIFLPMILKLFG